MIVCGDRLNFALSEKIAKSLDLNIFFPEITPFPDGEMRVSIFNSLVGKNVIFIKLYTPGDINAEIIKTAFIIDALVRAGAKKITGFFPYFPYVRSDHQKKSGEAVNLEVVARLFEGAGLSSILTIDPHTAKFPQFFTIPVQLLSTTQLFAREIARNIKNKPFSLVSPDNGGTRLIQPFAEIFHHASIVGISKERFPDGSVVATDIDGNVENICVIVDDIVSTGGTIAEAVKILKKKGGREFYIFATHGVFSKKLEPNLTDESIKRIYITDSVCIEEKNLKNLKILSIYDLVTSFFEKE